VTAINVGKSDYDYSPIHFNVHLGIYMHPHNEYCAHKMILNCQLVISREATPTKLFQPVIKGDNSNHGEKIFIPILLNN